MSPIKGLSESRRLPRLGKIHLGLKDERGIPRKVDYFVCPPEVQKVFGEKPKELRILIPVEDEEKWASQYYRCYSRTRGLVCKGDGEVALQMVDVATGAMADKDSKEIAMREVQCKGRECPDYKSKCKEVMCLQFLLPEVPGLGVWQIDTGSINSIRNINSAAFLIRGAFGRVSMLPLLLTVEPMQVQNPEDGKKQTVYVLNLRTNATMIDLLQQAKRPQLTQADELPVGDDEVPELIAPEWEGQAPPATEKPSEKAEAPKEKPKAKAKTEAKPRDLATIKTITDLQKALFQDFGLQPKDQLAELNINTWSELTDKPADAYAKVAAVRKP